MRQRLHIALFWGAVWGIAEATLGHLFHLATLHLPGITGFFLFPLGYVCMSRAYRKTDRPATAALVAGTAACIKLVDLPIPGNIAVKVINPALAIGLEGAVVWGALVLWRHRPGRVRWSAATVMSLAWRLAYVPCLLALCSPAVLRNSPIGGWLPFLRFAGLESLVNGFIIAGYAGLSARVKKHRMAKDQGKLRQSPAAAAGALALAILAQWVM